MKVQDLLTEMGRLWPNHTEQLRAWAPRYAEILGPHEGERLGLAWRQVLHSWRYDRPPLPAVIVEAIGGAAAAPAMGDDSPLSFGREHFQVMRAIAAELVQRWQHAHVDRLDGGLVALAATSMARDKARATAAAIMARGFREAPATARIDFTAKDWAEAEARGRSRRRDEAAGLVPGRLKPIHVVMQRLPLGAAAARLPSLDEDVPINVEGEPTINFGQPPKGSLEPT